MQIFSGRKKYDSELVSKKIEFDSKTPFSNENWLVCRAQAISCPVMNKIYHGLFFVLLFWEGITLIVFKFWHKFFFWLLRYKENVTNTRRDTTVIMLKLSPIKNT